MMDTIKSFFLFLFSIGLCSSLAGSVHDSKPLALIQGSAISFKDTVFIQLDEPRLTDTIIKGEETVKEKRRTKIVSALFAFPFPFGFMGAHRIMLGTSPWVPVVYAATFGGCFGVLPLIDFFVITFTDHIEYYENNPHVFMWIK